MRTILRDNYTPEMGAYHETLIIDEARHKKYLFDCDGVFTDITNPLVVSERGDSEDFAASQKWVTDIDDKVDGLAEDLGDEIQARTDADDAIWTEIESIEAASDVVDVVGTYAELEAYDTSKLHDNDLIKVLQDETHDNVIAYYRWSTSTDTFSYVGAEGPYYTESQIDTMMSGKQDTLIAGTNIQIASDGKTISATDTTYSDFTGATSQQAGAHGLVPAPTTSDPDNFLKGDGTWGRVASLETSTSPTTTGTFYDYYVQSASGQHRLGFDLEVNSNTGDVENAYLYLDDTYPLVNILPAEQTQEKLIAGSNISIAADGKTISATDTTYSVFTGATSQQAGVAGLVPAPTTADVDKVLKGNGTWGDAGGALTVFYVTLSSVLHYADFYTDQAKTTPATLGEIEDAFKSGTVVFRTETNSGTNVTCTDMNAYSLYTAIKSSTNNFTNFSFNAQTCVGGNSNRYTSRIYAFSIGNSNKNRSSLAQQVPFYDKNDIVTQNNLADSSNAGIAKLYTATGQNTDGSVTQKLFTDTVGDIETALQILNSGAGVP